MKHLVSTAGALCAALAFNLSAVQVQTVYAQEATEIEEVVVTGSRIRRNPLDDAAAIMDIGRDDITKSGTTNLGDAMQNLPIAGSAINSQFNVPGNSGFPQDGSGIGAGAVELAIRNVGAKRTLILVDGRRWVAGGSASGVASTVDLNSVPDNVIERIEILQDGASAIYGSDAIGGVVNIITDQDFEGFRMDVQAGSYLSEKDGESYEIAGLWGGGTEATHITFSASYKDERGVDTADRSRSAYPSPDATSCTAGGCSSFTPQGRFVLGPNFGFADVTLNNGVLNDGGANIPVWNPGNPGSGDFHTFSATDRFNFNGPGYNYLRTPNERVNLYTNVTHELSDMVDLFIRGSYTNRSSATKAAPEPLCLGNGCGNRVNDNFFISALNPYNPFGVDLSVANGNLEFFARRPLESGRRLYFQEIDVLMLSAGFLGEFSVGDRSWFWDLSAGYGDNRGFQEKENSHNAAKLQVAMGDPAVCAATPRCVPFNFFGGQGPDGTGSITQEMLDWVRFLQRDYSEQTLKDYAFNITGDIMDMPGGAMAFAAGAEYRDHTGSYRPDPVAESGDTAGIPAGRTDGGFDVTEFYAELSLPLLSGVAFADYLELNVAGRSSDYSTSGAESTYKVSGLWRPIEELSLRASVSTGIRAPGIGELFGGAAREDFTYLDPCADYTGIVGSANGGRDTPQPANIQANCATLLVPVGLAQLNPQQSATSAGNPDLLPESSDNWTAGVVWSPSWADGAQWTSGITMSLDFYTLEIDDAIQGVPPGDLVTACVTTLNPAYCDSVPRTSSGQLGLIDNQLQNIGGIEASGYDLMVNYLTPEFGIGQFGLTVNATYLNEYLEKTAGLTGGSETVTDRTGEHSQETFQRAFPEWRAVTSIDWVKERWTGGLSFRWVDEMYIVVNSTTRNSLDSAMFTDLRFSYNPSIADDAVTVTLGLNNVLDEDPPVCNPCGSIGMSRVSHDLPGMVGYLRVTYEHQ
jgi:iron complex outermembrane recepter protein